MGWVGLEWLVGVAAWDCVSDVASVLVCVSIKYIGKV